MGSRSAPLRRQGEAALYAKGRTEAVRDPWPRDPGANGPRGQLENCRGPICQFSLVSYTEEA